MTRHLLPPGTHSGVLVAFLVFVGLALLACVMVGSDSDETSDFYTANRALTPFQNGLALSGDYVSAATLLSTTGVVAMSGYDGISVALCAVLALGVLLLLAQPLHRAGAYTLGDVLTLRGERASVRIAAAVVALAISVPFLVAQLRSAGAATALMFGVTTEAAQQTCTALIGILMVCCSVLGGMRGASLIQVIKIVVTCATVTVMTALVLARFGWSPAALLDAAARGSGHPDVYLRPGLAMGTGTAGRLDHIGIQLTVVLGAAVTPHMLMRVAAAPSGAGARRSTRMSLGVVGVLCLMVTILGLGASAVIGGRTIAALGPNGQGAFVLLAARLSAERGTGFGDVLITAVACTVFITILAVVAGAALAAGAAFAHDLYATAARGRCTEQQEVRAAQWSAVAVGAVGIVLAVSVDSAQVQPLSILALAIAASTVLPAVVCTLWWRRFTHAGLLWTLYGGLVLALAVDLLSPAVSGGTNSLLPGVDFHLHTLQTPLLLSVPGALALGWMASTISRRRPGA